MVGEKCYEAPHGIGQVHSATGSLEGGGGVAYQGVWLCVYMRVCVPVLCMRACVHVCVCVCVLGQAGSTATAAQAPAGAFAP